MKTWVWVVTVWRNSASAEVVGVFASESRANRRARQESIETSDVSYHGVASGPFPVKSLMSAKEKFWKSIAHRTIGGLLISLSTLNVNLMGGEWPYILVAGASTFSMFLVGLSAGRRK